MSVTKGVLSNGVVGIILKIVRILDQLLLVPFFLTVWGAAYYGEWLTLTIIPSVLAFSDLGFGSAVSNSFVLAYASGNKQKAANLSKSGLFVISLSVVLGAVLTFVILLVGERFHLFDKSVIPVRDAMLTITFMMTAKLISFYSQLIDGYFRGAHKAALSGLMSSGQNILNLIVGFCTLYAGCGIVGYAVSQFIVAVLFTIAYFYVGTRLIDFKGAKGVILQSDLKMITAKGMGYLMTPIWQSIYFQGGTFVVRVTLGPESVAVFNTVRTVCRSVNQLFSIINGSIFPDLQYEYGRGNKVTVHKLFRIAVVFSMFIGLAGTVFLLLFGLDIYEWWTRSALLVPMNVWFTFMIGVLFNAVWWTSVVTYRMTNQPYHFAIMSTLTACLSVGVSYVLSMYLGLWGASIGAVIYDAIMMLYVLPDSCHLLGMKVKDLFIHIKEDSRFLNQKIEYMCKNMHL